jgi:RHS repeat-associated protein
MAFPGTVSFARFNTFYPQDGRLQRAILTGSARPGSSPSRAELDYTYEPDGLPLTLGMSGSAVAAAWTATYGHDNLGRLRSWQPDTGSPTVAYSYDSDGNLTSRIWTASGSSTPGQAVTYAVLAGARTVTTMDSAGASETDTYSFDGFGRVFDTPAVSVVMSEDDHIVRVIEKTGSRVDDVAYDGSGQRVLTLFGTNSGDTLLTLDDLFELRRGAAGSESRCRLHVDGRVLGDIVTSADGRRPTFYLEDNVGSIVAEGTDGTVSARARRDPFGNTFTSAASPDLPGDTSFAMDGSSRLGFGGHERDENWGMVDMLARAYSARLGRFVSPDASIGSEVDRSSHNAFAYVANSPAALIDPTGNQFIVIGSKDVPSDPTPLGLPEPSETSVGEGVGPGVGVPAGGGPDDSQIIAESQQADAAAETLQAIGQAQVQAIENELQQFIVEALWINTHTSLGGATSAPTTPASGANAGRPPCALAGQQVGLFPNVKLPDESSTSTRYIRVGVGGGASLYRGLSTFTGAEVDSEGHKALVFQLYTQTGAGASVSFGESGLGETKYGFKPEWGVGAQIGSVQLFQVSQTLPAGEFVVSPPKLKAGQFGTALSATVKVGFTVKVPMPSFWFVAGSTIMFPGAPLLYNSYFVGKLMDWGIIHP